MVAKIETYFFQFTCVKNACFERRHEMVHLTTQDNIITRSVPKLVAKTIGLDFKMQACMPRQQNLWLFLRSLCLFLETEAMISHR